MDFYDIFIFLVNLTGSKIIDIADAISYDRSYLSKWHNKKSLPNEDSWQDLSSSLGKYFSNNMDEDHIKKLIEIKPSIAYSISETNLEESLISLLDDAYALSLH